MIDMVIVLGKLEDAVGPLEESLQNRKDDFKLHFLYITIFID
jgi:hypothetical protein